jgi:hypothetical protein
MGELDLPTPCCWGNPKGLPPTGTVSSNRGGHSGPCTTTDQCPAGRHELAAELRISET